MALVVEQPESIDGGGNFINKPGVYHCVVTAVDENPAKEDGTPIDMLKVGVSCLTGTNPEQKDRTFELKLWHPKPDDKNDMAKKKQTRFCLATSLLGQHQPGQRATVEPCDALGRQLVLKLTWQRVKAKDKDGKDVWIDSDQYVDLHFADIWHIDDPEVAKTGVVLDAASLKMIPAALRKAVPVSGGNGTVKTAPVGAVGSTRGGVDLSNV